MNSHTPGPWHRNIKPARKYCIVFAGRNTHIAAICAPPGMSDAEIEANCDLIAAAPTLLEALKQIVDATQSSVASEEAANRASSIAHKAIAGIASRA